jgi:hypothetical protein
MYLESSFFHNSNNRPNSLNCVNIATKVSSIYLTATLIKTNEKDKTLFGR